MPDNQQYSSVKTPGLGDTPDVADMDVDLPSEPDADATITVDPETGDVTVDLNPETREDDDTEFDANLALQLSDQELGVIGNDLYEGIQADDQSRSGWVHDYA